MVEISSGLQSGGINRVEHIGPRPRSSHGLRDVGLILPAREILAGRQYLWLVDGGIRRVIAT
jgi:hypothetical protein